jgi:hypothetical protein
LVVGLLRHGALAHGANHTDRPRLRDSDQNKRNNTKDVSGFPDLLSLFVDWVVAAGLVASVSATCRTAWRGLRILNMGRAARRHTAGGKVRVLIRPWYLFEDYSFFSFLAPPGYGTGR